MDDFGPALFGIDSSTLRFEAVDTETVPGVTTSRATQALGEVPVLDSSLVFTGRGDSASTDALRVNAVRGRVFPDLTVGTTPTLTAEQAGAAAAAAAGGTADGEARLVVLPRDAGVLAWEVVVVGDQTDPAGTFSAGLYYIDAATGDLVDSRPASGDAQPPVPKISRISHVAGGLDARARQRRGHRPGRAGSRAHGVRAEGRQQDPAHRHHDRGLGRGRAARARCRPTTPPGSPTPAACPATW